MPSKSPIHLLVIGSSASPVRPLAVGACACNGMQATSAATAPMASARPAVPLRGTGHSSVSAPLRDLEEVRRGADDDAVADDGWRGECSLADRVLPEQLELRTGGDHEGVAVLAQGENLSVVGPWRRGKSA